jgi:hypothetical protein
MTKPLSPSETQELLEGLAATLGVNVDDQSPDELIQAANARAAEISLLADNEVEFDAYGLELGILQAMLKSLQGKAPEARVLH